MAVVTNSLPGEGVPTKGQDDPTRGENGCLDWRPDELASGFGPATGDV